MNKRIIRQTVYGFAPCSPWKWMKGKWWIYKKERDNWHETLKKYMATSPWCGLGKSDFPKAKLHIVQFRPKRSLLKDSDNIMTSLKPLIDCMKTWIEHPRMTTKWVKLGTVKVCSVCGRIKQKRKRVCCNSVLYEGQKGLEWFYDDSTKYVEITTEQKEGIKAIEFNFEYEKLNEIQERAFSF